MLTLIAAAFEDGLAFVKRGNKIQFTRPPYLGSNLLWTDEEKVEKAISAHGFVSCNQSFETWSELVAFLKDRFLEARKKLGLVELAGLSELLPLAPASVLSGYLDRVEAEMLPAREWTPALNLLTDMLKVESVLKDRSMFLRAISLLRKCLTEINRMELSKEEIVDEEGSLRDEFPECAERYGTETIMERVSSVKGRGVVWA